MKEMKDFYQWVESKEGFEDALAFIKEHNGKISDLEAKVRIAGKEKAELEENLATLTGEKEKLSALVEEKKGEPSIEVKELQQKVNDALAKLTEAENKATEAEEKRIYSENRNSVIDAFSKGGLDTNKPAFSDFLSANYGKSVNFQEGKLIANTPDGEKIGDAAVEYFKTTRADLTSTKEGTGSRPVQGQPKADKYAGLTSMQKLTAGMQ